MGTRAFIHCPQLEQYPYPDSCPFKTSRAGKTLRLLESMGMLPGPDKVVVAPTPLSRKELEWFHTPSYLDAMEAADSGEFDYAMLRYGLGTSDCPVFAGMYPYATWASGATVTGARLIVEGKARIAFNPSGGYHHAFADRAGGFCYVNDIVLGCMALAKAGKRVVFLDIDVHHCDGVQAAFYNRRDVMTISLHQDGRTLFPGTGFVEEIGEGDGRGFAVNVPLPIGTYDAAYLRAIHKVVLPLLHAFGPDVIVLEAGADTLANDPLANLSLTNNTMADVIGLLLAFGKPILATGGGGYNPDNTARAWALVWAALCGEDAGGELTAGLGGVLLETTDWHGGLRDRQLAPDWEQRQAADQAVDQVIEQVKRTVFPIHGL
jgi:acetoin utilization protein AcuC